MDSNDLTDPVTFAETVLSVEPTDTQREFLNLVNAKNHHEARAKFALREGDDHATMLQVAIWTALYFCFCSTRTKIRPVTAIKVENEDMKAAARELLKLTIESSHFHHSLAKDSAGRVVFPISWREMRDVHFPVVAIEPYGEPMWLEMDLLEHLRPARLYLAS